MELGKSVASAGSDWPAEFCISITSMVIDFSAVKYTKDSSIEADSINNFYFIILDFCWFWTYVGWDAKAQMPWKGR